MLTDTQKKRIQLLDNAKKGREDLEYGKTMVEMAKRKDKMQYGGNLDDSIERCILKFKGDLSVGEKDKLKEEMWKARVLNLIDPDEFFLYDFINLRENERYSYVGNREKESLCAIINDNDGISQVFMDKWKTYQVFKRYYGREMIHIASEMDKETFLDFAKRHGKVFVKQIDGSQGKGIFVVDSTENLEASWSKIMGIIRGGGGVGSRTKNNTRQNDGEDE